MYIHIPVSNIFCFFPNLQLLNKITKSINSIYVETYYTGTKE